MAETVETACGMSISDAEALPYDMNGFIWFYLVAPFDVMSTLNGTIFAVAQKRKLNGIFAASQIRTSAETPTVNPLQSNLLVTDSDTVLFTCTLGGIQSCQSLQYM